VENNQTKTKSLIDEIFDPNCDRYSIESCSCNRVHIFNMEYFFETTFKELEGRVIKKISSLENKVFIEANKNGIDAKVESVHVV
jgi:hypothetical protein